jgi:hypothetical protein
MKARGKAPSTDSNRLKRKHFALEEWADFARGLAEGKQKASMHQHLVEGCSECQKAFELWRSVSQAANRESTYAPPEYALRAAKGQFGMLHVFPEVSGARKAVRVIFDSFKQPALQGVRSAGKKPRQIVYQVGNHYLDIRMESQPGSKRLGLIGQLRDSTDPARKMGETQVLLLRGQDRIGRTTTNAFGEFRLEFDRRDNLWLAIGVPGEAGIVVSLARVIEPGLVEARL